MGKKDIQGMNLQKNNKQQKKGHSEDVSFKDYFTKKRVAIGAMSALALGGGFVAINENAQDALKTTTNVVTVRALRARKSSTFEKKDVLLDSQSIQDETSMAEDRITPSWSENSSEDIRTEVKRQRDAGLDAYVVQWGDTIEGLASAVGVSADEMRERNNLSKDSDLYAGDILDGILYQVSNAERVTDQDITSISTKLDVEKPTLPAKSEVVADVEESTTPKFYERYSEDQVDAITEAFTDEQVEDFKELTTSRDVAKFIGDLSEEQRDVMVGHLSEDQVSALDAIITGKDFAEASKDELDSSVEHDSKVESEDVDLFKDVDPADFEENKASDAEVSEDVDEIDVFEGEDPDTEPLDYDLDSIDASEIIQQVSEVEDVTVESEIIEDSELDEGVEVIESAGLDGLTIHDVTIVEYPDGSTDRTVNDSEVIYEPVAKVVRVGTKPVDKDKLTTSKELKVSIEPYDTETIEVDNLLPGEELVVEAGQNGFIWSLEEVTRDEFDHEVDSTVLDEDFNGEFDGMPYSSAEMVTQIVHVGKEVEGNIIKGHKYDDIKRVKSEVTPKLTIDVVKIPAGEDYTLDDGSNINLSVDEEYIHTEGKAGKYIGIFKVYSLDGKEVYREQDYNSYILSEDFEESVTITEMPENREIYIGE